MDQIGANHEKGEALVSSCRPPVVFDPTLWARGSTIRTWVEPISSSGCRASRECLGCRSVDPGPSKAASTALRARTDPAVSPT